LLSGGRVPNREGAIGGGEDGLVGIDKGGEDDGVIRAQDGIAAVRTDDPEADGAVGGSGNDMRIIGADGGGEDTGWGTGNGRQITCGSIEDVHGATISRDEDFCSIMTIGGAVDFAGAGVEKKELFSGVCIPDPDSGIGAGGDDASSIGVEPGTEDVVAFMAAQRDGWFACGGIPDHGDAGGGGRGGGDDAGSVRAEGGIKKGVFVGECRE